MSEPDDITIRRIWKLEGELADLRRMVTSPTTVLTALESDRKEYLARFEGIDGRLDWVDRRLEGIDQRLSAIEGQLAAILAAVKGGGG